MAEVARAVRAIKASGTEVSGCSEQDVLTSERQLAVRLPGSYRNFLLGVGRNAGRFMVGSSFTFDELPKLRSWAQETLSGDGVPELSSSEFVFLDHQGYQFLFFDAPAGPDPPVFHYHEGAGRSVEVANTFSGWLRDAVRDQLSDLS